MKKSLFFAATALSLLVSAGCGDAESSGASEDDTITIAWYPNESGSELEKAREGIGDLVEEATGKTVEHETTTDYIVAIESIVNGNADIAYMGAQGYIEAHDKNENVVPLAVSSGESGTLDDAMYNSWLSVKDGNEGPYEDGDGYSIDNIVDKKFSFVSNSSTSGFKVPSSDIVTHFSEKEEYSDLTQDDLLEGGEFFSEVLFGGSHQGSAVNLLTDKADVAAFCDVCVENYVENVEGEENSIGAVYQVSEDAADPFQSLSGEKFKLISVTPVLNAPFVMNEETLSEDTQSELVEAFTSDETANNEEVFVPEDTDEGLFYKTDNERFLEVEDDWFEPIRELSN
ncbi:phosphate/phosphite/phosphonate ABC transporter substrate-binding protein [Alteribacillus sp. YIM 98480]|uniref:phosphate/phosphite/phosphonate ABC transporter substrate-binding protein n=1 Tax=Alteribacillus sp. YIM 98480 TaxID=2606599 RepID=UPI00131C0E0C|nr:phosphate/phosphite/phosphonate ABC transporter substrate-binding protein [Alteribacillus sp. YIM 98480]